MFFPLVSPELSVVNALDGLKMKLKSVTKIKFNKERHLFQMRNTERSLCEELYIKRAEIELLTEQLEDLKDKISETGYEISRVEIYKAAETSRMEIRYGNLNIHKKGFEDIFEKERDLSELRDKELKEREAGEQELVRQRQAQIAEKNEQQAREVADVERECETIERECAVLRKRNNAIMLKLRRKLVETEDARREVLNRQGTSNDN